MIALVMVVQNEFLGRMTQRALAVAVGTTEAYMCKLERGHHEPSDEMLEKIASAFGITPKQLRTETP